MFSVCHIAGVACTGSAILTSWSCSAECYYLRSCHLPYRLVLSCSPEIFRNKRSCPPEGGPVVMCHTGGLGRIGKERKEE